MAGVRTTPASLKRVWAFLSLGGLVLAGSLMSAEVPVAPPADLPGSEEQVVEVRVVGHKRVAIEKITPQIRTRAGRVFSPDTVEEDVRRLNATRWFVQVKPYVKKVAGGRQVIYEVLERPVLEYVRFVGHEKVSRKQLLKESGVKGGDPADPFAVEEGRRKIEEYYRGKGFGKVQVSVLEGAKTGDRGAIYRIHEGPKQRILWTQFQGNAIASDERLKTLVQSKPGIFWLFKGNLDRKLLDEDVNRLQAYYRGLGFFEARVGRPSVELTDKQDWATVTFVIDEGPRYEIRNVSVIGNKKFESQQLTQDLKLKPGQYFNQSDMQMDVSALQDTYGGVGYIFADVRPEPRFDEEKKGVLDLVYHISEGSRYRVGRVDVEIKGLYPHTRVTTVLNRMSLQPGDIVDIRELRASERRLKASGLFRNDPAQGVSPKIVFTPPSHDSEEAVARRPKSPNGFRGQSPDEPDQAIGLRLQGESAYPENPGAWEENASVTPHDPTSWAEPDSLPRVPVNSTAAEPEAGSMTFNGNAEAGWIHQVVIDERSHQWRRVPRSANEARGASQDSVLGLDPGRAIRVAPEGILVRAQSPDPVQAQGRLVGSGDSGLVVRGQYSADSGYSTSAAAPVSSTRSPLFGVRPTSTTSTPWAAPAVQSSVTPANNTSAGSRTANGGWGAPARPAQIGLVKNDPDGLPNNGGVLNPAGPAGGTFTPNAGSAVNGSATSPLFAPNGGPPAEVLPAIPNDSGSPLFDPNEDIPLHIPLNPIVEDTETGRLMFSVGVNSEAGLIGSVVIDEQNFDWTRFPRSWEEIRNRTAWRGRGQRFRAEAMPGTEVQKYAVTFQEPNLLDSQVSLSLSGFFYNRIFTEWSEERVGGRIGLAYQFTHDLSGTVAYRGAKVSIYNPIATDVPELNRALNSSALHGFSVGLNHDTRDNPFLATEGHLIEMSLEQVVGTFQYPRAEIDVRQYFLVHQRADGSGRHVISLSGRFAWTGDDTPIYENYFIGGFSTLRGFRFRRASPVDFSNQVGDVTVGGKTMLLASAEYIFPITADDSLRGVVFCDTGTVERDIRNWTDRYRVAPGFGLRITVPAMGPAPIALDFAFPVSSNAFDEKEVFSFWIGFLR